MIVEMWPWYRELVICTSVVHTTMTVSLNYSKWFLLLTQGRHMVSKPGFHLAPSLSQHTVASLSPGASPEPAVSHWEFILPDPCFNILLSHTQWPVLAALGSRPTDKQRRLHSFSTLLQRRSISQQQWAEFSKSFECIIFKFFSHILSPFNFSASFRIVLQTNWSFANEGWEHKRNFYHIYKQCSLRSFRHGSAAWVPKSDWPLFPSCCILNLHLRL